ncbi:hypothetical protein J4458_07255 [Candidatus Woesearchaeota archaeon]|nr:hypothetical protein [Candidatus Woesearchaeota archaeon]
MSEKCTLCKGEMRVIREEVVADTKYKIYKCDKCNRQAAKSESKRD